MSSGPVNRCFIKVAVPCPLRKCFDYSTHDCPAPGSRVEIPFGHRNLVGVVIATLACEPSRTVKPVIRIIDPEPVIPPTLLELMLWAADYYHHPVGEVILMALPPQLRTARVLTDPESVTVYSRNNEVSEESALSLLSRSRRQRQLYEHLQPDHRYSLAMLSRHPALSDMKNLKPILGKLVTRNLVSEASQFPTTDCPDIIPFPGQLTEEQLEAVNRVNQYAGIFQTFVLYGITGSGKTEVYLHIIEQILARGQQSLVLVPEISLTPQLVSQFTNRIGKQVWCYHSSMSPSDRYKTWWKARTGTAGVILGTRSAVFLPVSRLGAIMIDEEHDSSYKQQEGFRYHARDMAVKRASIENIPVILGSATPSMESMEHARSGKYKLLCLTERTGKSQLPGIFLVSLRKHPAPDGLSPHIVDAIAKQLDLKQQTILYINRRGFSPVVHCGRCEWQAKCPRCDARLTYHRSVSRFVCHYCGKAEHSYETCPRCDHRLSFLGSGTQRIEEALAKQFPQASIFRFDRDRLQSLESLHKAITQVSDQRIDIIIGTQLITKGHNFPKVTLVGVINPDQGLYSIDFRAPETLFQQLVQVAGRAGRGPDPGKVIIQTAHPRHVYLDIIRNHRFSDFYQVCRDEREMTRLPPFSHIALWRASSVRAGAGLEFLGLVQQMGTELINALDLDTIELMDPVYSPMQKIDRHYRAQLLVKSSNRRLLHKLLGPWVRAVEGTRANRKKIRWSIDVDPMDLY